MKRHADEGGRGLPPLGRSLDEPVETLERATNAFRKEADLIAAGERHDRS